MRQCLLKRVLCLRLATWDPAKLGLRINAEVYLELSGPLWHADASLEEYLDELLLVEWRECSLHARLRIACVHRGEYQLLRGTTLALRLLFVYDNTLGLSQVAVDLLDLGLEVVTAADGLGDRGRARIVLALIDELERSDAAL